MRISVFRLVAQLTIVGCLGACSSTTSATTPLPSIADSGGPPFALIKDPAGTFPSLVLMSSVGPALDLLNAQDNQFAQVKTPVRGWVAIDKEGAIYLVGSSQNATKLWIYPPPYSAKPTVISFASVGIVRGISVDWKSNAFAVLTDPFDPQYRSAVSFFRHGATAPCAVVKAPSNWSIGPAAGFDASGTLYMGSSNGSGANVVSVAGECHATGFAQYSPTLPYIEYLQFNAANDLVIDESDGATNPPLYTFAHPTNGQLGKVLSTTTLGEINGNPSIVLTLSSDGKDLWAESFQLSSTPQGLPTFNSGGLIGLYRYPAGGAPVKTINFSKIASGAVYPQLIP